MNIRISRYFLSILTTILCFFMISCDTTSKEEILKQVVDSYVVKDEVYESFYLEKEIDGVKITWSVEPSNYPVTLINEQESASQNQYFRVVRLNSNYTYQIKGIFKIGKNEVTRIYDVTVVGKNNT